MKTRQIGGQDLASVLEREAALEALRTGRPSKYHNVQTEMDGYTFGSKAEARRYGELKLLGFAREIRRLGVHPVFELQCGFVDRNGKRRRPITYEADFRYWVFGDEDPPVGRWVVEDVKGKRTAVFNIKLKLFLFKYPQYDFRLIPA